MSIAISFDRVSKRFTYHENRIRSLHDLFFRLKKEGLFFRNDASKVYWALKDISFEIAPGDTVGLIGHNGAGKSTLLKLISQVILPTRGIVTLNGRISALLELGTGFHPDLTGRENIYLNGSILGYSHKEIGRKLNDIIEFADIGKFIDYPLKYYSSGMQVRLGFAIAIHSEPDILLIDEVLAVGDFAFQRKCIERIEALKQKDVTILLVSHDLGAIQQTCNKTILMQNGEIRAFGETQKVIRLYQAGDDIDNATSLPRYTTRAGKNWGSGEIKIKSVQLLYPDGTPAYTAVSGQPLTLRISYQANQRIENPVFGFEIYHPDGLKLLEDNTRLNGFKFEAIEDKGVIDCLIDPLPLLPNKYELSAYVYSWDLLSPYDHQYRIYTLHVESEDAQPGRGTVKASTRWQGLVKTTKLSI